MEIDMAADGRNGRRAVALSPQRIIEASLELLESDGPEKFTFRALGARLGADPTAVYRHFRDKDDLLLAIADELLARSLESFEPAANWRETLRTLCLRMRKVYLAHPHTAVLATIRTTRRPAEMRAVELILSALAQAGFSPDRAVYYYRALADFALSWSCMAATYAALDAGARSGDESAWGREYALAPAQRYPHLAAAAPYLPEVDEEENFALALDLMLEAIAARAANTGTEEAGARTPAS
ncbi:TetR/AcrR family transcriptional regulator C-terminal domain-containing protein [Streptomyces sp. NPDC001508]|uniref:TetR/AcrR family transcriptional regulator C-terminal domain-containing protein n=1 Tax=Streptomyces sp. NPDC001508 TaxID=3154656 RepID=UPI00331CB3FB